VKKVSNSSSNSDQSLLLAGSSFLILLVLAMIGLQSQPPVGSASTATMIFSFSGSKDRVFSGHVMEKMTVLEAVLASAQGDSIRVVYRVDDKNNLSLSSINNDLNLKDHRWSFYLNRALINTQDINKIYVKTGDLVEAKYQ